MQTKHPLSHYIKQQAVIWPVTGSRPFLMEGGDNLWYVASGSIEVFSVQLIDGVPSTMRYTHLLTRKEGCCLFGMDVPETGISYGLIAVGSADTELYHATLSDLVGTSRFIDEFPGLIDDWIVEFSRCLTRNISPLPKANASLQSGEHFVMMPGQIIRSSKKVLWAEAASGEVLFISNEDIIFGEDTALFPITPDTWLESYTSQTGNIALTFHSTASIINRLAIRNGLKIFHKLATQRKAVENNILVLREHERLQEKAQETIKARTTGLVHIASVLDKGASARAEAEMASESSLGNDPVFTACHLVGAASGIHVIPYPESEDRKNKGESGWHLDERLHILAKASGIRTRQVVLRDKWYKKDQGPILSRLAETGEPVALLPTSPTSYEYVNPNRGERVPVVREVAESLSHFGYSLYRSFPDVAGGLTLLDVIKFGLKGLKSDVHTLLLMGALIGILGSMTPYFIGQVFDVVIPQAEKGLLYQYTLALIAGAFASCAFDICRGIAVLRIQGKMDYSLQAALWSRLLNLPTWFFRDYSVGDLADRLMGVAKIRDLVSGSGITAILGGMTSVFYVFLMFKYSVPLALTAIGLTSLLVVYTFVLNWSQLKHQTNQIEMNGKITGLVLQLINGVAKLRVTGSENFAFRRWAKDFASYRRLSIRVGKLDNKLATLQSGFPLISSMTIFAVLVGVRNNQQTADTAITTGDFIAFNAAFGMFLGAMLALCDTSMNLFRIQPIYKRLKPVLMTPMEVDEVKKHPGSLTGNIEVSHLHFRYNPDGPLITKDVSFKIRPGEFTAFVGGSGSGKSTILRLLMGFEKPEAGTIYYDHQDLDSLDLREVRQQIGIVLQTSRTLSGTIFENIVGSSALTVEDAWEAARMAGLEEDIKQMPMGMHTVVGEGGGTFSGGQRQRLMIARAVVRKPNIMFLDEATSALDNRTQAQVTESLDNLHSTRVVIAHRLSTVRKADTIYVVEKGAIAESGTFNDLMERKGLFFELARRQIAE